MSEQYYSNIGGEIRNGGEALNGELLNRSDADSPIVNGNHAQTSPTLIDQRSPPPILFGLESIENPIHSSAESGAAINLAGIIQHVLETTDSDLCREHLQNIRESVRRAIHSGGMPAQRAQATEYLTYPTEMSERAFIGLVHGQITEQNSFIAFCDMLAASQRLAATMRTIGRAIEQELQGREFQCHDSEQAIDFIFFYKFYFPSLMPFQELCDGILRF